MSTESPQVVITPVETPWLKIPEAAAYCRMSVGYFRKMCCNYPNLAPVSHGRNTGRVFHIKDLDAFMRKGGFCK